MAGALAGAIANSAPPSDPADRELIASEARRLESLANDPSEASFPHPDPLKWQPPRTLADAVGLIGDRVAVAGLGPAVEESDLFFGQGRDQGCWQWLRLDYGQRILIKRRPQLSALPESAWPRHRPPRSQQATLASSVQRESDVPESAEDAVSLVVASNFDGELILKCLRHFSTQDHGITKAAVFGALVAQALARRTRD
jgi:hypothetical protein